MKQIFLQLYNLYIDELHRLNIGYEFNSERIQEMFDLLNTIDYIESGNPPVTDIYKIIAYYE